MNQYQNQMPGNCGCTRDRCSLSERPRADKSKGFGVYDRELAALYLPVQSFADLYDLEAALCRGTLFRGLDKPFSGGVKEGCCRGQR